MFLRLLRLGCHCTKEQLPKIKKSNGNTATHSFGRSLSPIHFRRKNALPVSYYALFKGLLLLSEPSGCFSILTSFATERPFRGLSW
jgi:hypothetical protein